MTKALLTISFQNVLLSHCAALAGLYVFVLNQQCGLIVLYSYTHSTLESIIAPHSESEHSGL